MSNVNEAGHEAINELIASATSIIGSAAGAGIGGGLAGPAGGMIGAAYGASLTRVLFNLGAEIKNRVLSDREEARIGTVFYFAIEKIRENEKAEKELRTDGFFQDQPGERSSAKEILEATLFAAQKEHEEKKLQFYGNLYANIPFHSWVDRAQANFLIRQAKDLSYRQLISFFVDLWANFN